MKLGPLQIAWKSNLMAESQVNVPMERTAAAAESLPAGLPGTPIFHGFLEDFGEYNPQLEGLTAIRTYEKMRRSDAQVAATLLACELPIRAANWDVLPASPAALDREIAALERSLFPSTDPIPVASVFSDLRRADSLIHSKKTEDQDKGEKLLHDVLKRIRY